MSDSMFDSFQQTKQGSGKGTPIVPQTSANMPYNPNPGKVVDTPAVPTTVRPKITSASLALGSSGVFTEVQIPGNYLKIIVTKSDFSVDASTNYRPGIQIGFDNDPQVFNLDKVESVWFEATPGDGTVPTPNTMQQAGFKNAIYTLKGCPFSKFRIAQVTTTTASVFTVRYIVAMEAQGRPFEIDIQ